jgi:hypothetical protein
LLFPRRLGHAQRRVGRTPGQDAGAAR